MSNTRLDRNRQVAGTWPVLTSIIQTEWEQERKIFKQINKGTNKAVLLNQFYSFDTNDDRMSVAVRIKNCAHLK